MSLYGQRDGAFIVKKLTQENKILVEDVFIDPIASSATFLANNAAVGVSASDWIKHLALGAGSVSGLDYARVIKITNAQGADATRAGTVYIAGYNGEGEYIQENVTVPLTDGSTGSTNNAFLNLQSMKWWRDAGTGYSAGSVCGTVDVGVKDVYGLSKPLEKASDILSIRYIHVPGTAAAPISSVAMDLASATLFDKTYNTLDLTTRPVTGSTCVIKYLSKWQD